MREEYCIILDFLPSGYADRRHPEPTAQAIGTSFFSLLELVPREGINLRPGEEVYIGDGKREQIRFIKSQIDYNYLTNMAQNELKEIVEAIVKKNEKKFVDFFNRATTITPRMHQLQLLPGIGKKHIMDILDERKKKPFDSFQEILTRVRLFPDPVKIIVKRIMEELSQEEKYYLFVNKVRKRYNSKT
jgi:putative nucleotide binding protein